MRTAHGSPTARSQLHNPAGWVMCTVLLHCSAPVPPTLPGTRWGSAPFSLPPSWADRNLGRGRALLPRPFFMRRRAPPATVFRRAPGAASRTIAGRARSSTVELAAHNGLVAGSTPAGPTRRDQPDEAVASRPPGLRGPAAGLCLFVSRPRPARAVRVLHRFRARQAPAASLSALRVAGGAIHANAHRASRHAVLSVRALRRVRCPGVP